MPKQVAAALKYDSLLDLLPRLRGSNRVIGGVDSRRPLMHRELHAFVSQFELRRYINLASSSSPPPPFWSISRQLP